MFNRVKYDSCAGKTSLSDNVSIFSHSMDVSRFVHGETCRNEKGIVGAASVSTIVPHPEPEAGSVQSAHGAMVTLENDLRGQTRPLTSCPLYGYRPQAGVISSREIYKPVTHPVIRTDMMSDLPGCQMIDYNSDVPRRGAQPARPPGETP